VQGQQRNIGYFDNLEANSRNVTNSVTLPTETSNQNFIATIVGNKSCYFFAILYQLDSNTFPDGRVGLFSFYSTEVQAHGKKLAKIRVGLQRRAQVSLLVLLVVPLLVAAVAAELPGGAEPSALPCGTRARMRGQLLPADPRAGRRPSGMRPPRSACAGTGPNQARPRRSRGG
uniref:Uncharacterized protein n=1 Tax=Athene cunicularia TaxID=194338 RepID=A0A663N7S8_ATHCN